MTPDTAYQNWKRRLAIVLRDLRPYAEHEATRRRLAETIMRTAPSPATLDVALQHVGPSPPASETERLRVARLRLETLARDDIADFCKAFPTQGRPRK